MGGDNAGWGVIGLIVGGIVTGLFAWLTQRGKSSTDEIIAVRAEWQKLNGALVQRLNDVEAELAALRVQHNNEIAEIRRAHNAEVDEMRRTHRAEMKAMRDLNEGLQRMIAQNSKTTAYLMGETPVINEDKDDG